jgi:hypothetical protein
MTDLRKQTDAAMKVLSELSARAKETGDGDLMYAANRAWTQLYNHQTISLKDAIRAHALTATNGDHRG